jgi:hypothetical protein
MQLKLYAPQQAHAELTKLWPQIKAALQNGHKLELTIKREKRSLDQNALLWSCLTDLSKQVEWYGNKLTKEEFKDLLTAGLKKQKAIPGIDGGFVMVGSSTSSMTKEEMSDLITLAHAFGDERSVKWSPTSIGSFDDQGREES